MKRCLLCHFAYADSMMVGDLCEQCFELHGDDDDYDADELGLDPEERYDYE